MRPDKKKKLHHDSQKAKNRALASSNNSEKISGKSRQSTITQSSNSTNAPVEDAIGPCKVDVLSIDNQNENENDALNTERNLPKDYSKRKIESNWTKYELPPTDSDHSEQEEEVMTGLDFNYVIQNALKSDSMFRMKAEKEWEEKQTMFTNEIFSLDLTSLEKVVSCVPLPVQLGISKSQFEEQLFCPDGYRHLVEKAKNNLKNWKEEVKEEPKDDIENVNQRLVSMLISRPLSEDKNEKSSGESGDNSNFQCNDISNRSQDIKKKQTPSISNSSVAEVPLDSDLEQLLSADSIQNKQTCSAAVNDNQIAEIRETKPAQSDHVKSSSPVLLSCNEAAKNDSVTSLPCSNDENKTKNLEDWLDDFLSD